MRKFLLAVVLVLGCGESEEVSRAVVEPAVCPLPPPCEPHSTETACAGTRGLTDGRDHACAACDVAAFCLSGDVVCVQSCAECD